MPEETAAAKIGNSLSGSNEEPVGEEGNTPSDSPEATTPEQPEQEPSTEASTDTEATSQDVEESEQTEASQSEEGDDEPSEQEEFFYKATEYKDEESPYDTQYETAEDAKQGIWDRDQYVAQLESQLDEIQSQYENEVEEYESTLAEKEAKVQQFTEGLDDQQFKQHMVTKIMHEKDEELAAKDPQELEGEEARKYWQLQGAAEDQYDREQQEALEALEEDRKQQKQREKEQKQKRQEAIEAVNSKIEESLPIQNPEDKHRLNQKLGEQVTDDLALRDALVANQESFGDTLTDLLLTGLRNKMKGDVQKTVKETVENTKTVPEQPTPPPKNETAPRTAKDKIAQSIGGF